MQHRPARRSMRGFSRGGWVGGRAGCRGYCDLKGRDRREACRRKTRTTCGSLSLPLSLSLSHYLSLSFRLSFSPDEGLQRTHCSSLFDLVRTTSHSVRHLDPPFLFPSKQCINSNISDPGSRMCVASSYPNTARASLTYSSRGDRNPTFHRRLRV